MKIIYSFAYILLICAPLQVLNSQNIVINEILASNVSANADEDGDHEDWVELFNAGSTSVNLAGYGLTDDPSQPLKWVFPNITIEPGGYKLVWCSDKNRVNPSNPLHANFKISSGVESVYLNNASGTQVVMAAAMSTPADVSYGKSPNGTGPFLYFEIPTPGAINNTTAYTSILPPPVFSHPAGFYTTGFDLTISTSVAGASIIYTLDGSEPEQSNLGGTTYNYKNQYPELPGQPVGPMLSKSFTTLSYTAPVSIVDRTSQPNKIASISSTYDFVPEYIPSSSIFKGTVVRAKVIKPGAISTEAASRTYFVTPVGASRFSLPVISFGISENKLYDFEDGIYVAGIDYENWRIQNPTTEPYYIEDIANFFRRGIDNERVANMSYFVNGTEVINQDVGIRISGGSSRAWQNKSLAIHSRDEYGDETLDYTFFPNQPTNFKGLILRNSGSDFFETMFRDALCHNLM
ncbi:MAG TPA: lamin tail domain-containing protein, partial [Flavobacterium sp.]